MADNKTKSNADKSDISDLHSRLEKANENIKRLAESELKYRNLVEMAVDGICIIQDDRIKYCNNSLVQLLGYDFTRLVDSPLSSFIDVKDINRITDELSAIYQGKTDHGLILAGLIKADDTILNTELHSSRFEYQGRPALMVIVRDITERIKARKALLESEEKYRLLVESQGEGVGYVDQDDRFTFANPAAEEIFGVDPGQLVGRPLRDFLSKKNWEIVQKQTNQRHKGRISTYDLEIRRPDRKKRQLIVTATPKYSPEGQYIGAFGIFRDMTERKNVMEALRESETRFRLLAETTSAAIFLYKGNNLIYVNSSAETITEYSKDELLKMNFWDILHPDYREIAIKRGRARQRGEKVPTRYEVMLRTKSGKDLWVDFSAGTLTYEGSIVVFGTAFDITDHKMAEQALRHSELRYRRLTENAHDMIWRTNFEGVVFYVNNAVSELLGYDPMQAIGLEAKDYIEPESLANLRRHLKSALTSSPPKDHFQVEVRYIKKDKSTIDCELVVTLVRDAQGKVTMLEGISRDITRRKEAQKEKERLEKQLYKAQKMESIGTLAGGIAHDFNNSLQVVLCSLDLVNESLDRNDPAYSHLKTIKAASKQMTKWTEDLLSYARGSFSEKRPLDINKCVKNSIKVAAHNMTGRINLTQNLDKSLPKIMASAGEMEQVVVNLLINASEAIADKGTIEVITTTAEKMPASSPEETPMAGNFIKLSVKDNGHGMDEQTKQRIFEPFFTTKFIGRGMGMSVVIGIIESCDGRIIVQSEPDVGTCYDIYMPVTSVKPDSDILDIPISSGVKAGEKIILVDDQIELVRSTAGILSARGYEVLTAHNGKEAIDLAGENRDLGLVILDMVMPGMSGFEAYVQLKQLLPKSKFLIVSGYDEHGPAQEVMEAGADMFLKKPFEIPTLFQAIEKLIPSRV